MIVLTVGCSRHSRTRKESDYNYLHRRWEALGWHYWYEHREDGHTLVLSDNTIHQQTHRRAPMPDVRWHAAGGSLDEDGDWQLDARAPHHAGQGHAVGL